MVHFVVQRADLIVTRACLLCAFEGQLIGESSTTSSRLPMWILCSHVYVFMVIKLP